MLNSWRYQLSAISYQLTVVNRERDGKSVGILVTHRADALTPRPAIWHNALYTRLISAHVRVRRLRSPPSFGGEIEQHAA
jgi:hypothetical protein